MSDILDNINGFINRIEKSSSILPKQSVTIIINYLMEDNVDDRVSLEGMKMMVEKHWSAGNLELHEHFNKLLQYYNIVESKMDILERKFVTEKRGGQLVKRLYMPKNKQKILDILKGT
jgi:hypothetical protein